MVARAVPARHASLRPLFDFLDTDHSGSLSLQELRAGLKDDKLQVCLHLTWPQGSRLVKASASLVPRCWMPACSHAHRTCQQPPAQPSWVSDLQHLAVGIGILASPERAPTVTTLPAAMQAQMPSGS